VAYLHGTADRAINPAWSRAAVPARLGVATVELPGADHSPFLSQPADLADALESVLVRP
jgi:pimeloyl-ACP methyl ester carboxylesterase